MNCILCLLLDIQDLTVFCETWLPTCLSECAHCNMQRLYRIYFLLT